MAGRGGSSGLTTTSTRAGPGGVRARRTAGSTSAARSTRRPRAPLAPAQEAKSAGPPGAPLAPLRRRRPREERLLTTTLTGRRYWTAVSSSPITLANPSDPVTAMQERPGWAHWAAMAYGTPAAIVARLADKR